MSAMSNRAEVVDATLPTGTVTFVFTDIEGSTARWERDRAAMQEAVRRHDAIMHAVVKQHHGRVFKTIGDAFCVAFSRPEDALAATLAAQRELAAHDFASVGGLDVRAAMHTGTADERDGDYFGPTVNRVARLLGIASGGQVLVSGVARDLLSGSLPAQVSLADLGQHRLRDLTRPERVFQLNAPDLRTQFPALRSLEALPNNLPLQMTSFIGRDAEIAEITALLATHRLVTLVGSGGIGKTRTALQAAANLLDGGGDGVWLIELAPLAKGEYIVSAVAKALGVRLAADGDPLEHLLRALAPKRALLVFDNCEHLIEPAGQLIAAILRACRAISVLATSRQGLGVAGEETYRLPSLPVPGPLADGVLSASAAASCPAVELFVTRARAVDKRFVLTDDSAGTVAEICRRLDGIPLAIELAAARVKILSPRQLSQRLDERFRVLTGGSRDALARQQTLRALIDWSHDLLDDRERVVFRRLGIFVSGFTLEGAVAVAGSDDFDELDVVDVLASLVDKSLMLAETAGDTLRYRLLESTRVYAHEKLVAAGERDAAADRHLRQLRDRFAQAEADYERTARRAALDALLASELDDVRAALDHAITSSSISLGAELLIALRAGLWSFLGHAEALRRCEAFCAALSADHAVLRARMLTMMSLVLTNSVHYTRSLQAARAAIAQARLGGDLPTLADALSNTAFVLVVSGGDADEAQAALAEAQAIPMGDLKASLLRRLNAQANVSEQRGDVAGAVRAYEELRAEYRSIGDVDGELMTVVNLAEAEHGWGRTTRAVALAREAFRGGRVDAHHSRQLGLLTNLAGYLVAIDDCRAGCAAACDALRQLAVREPESPMAAVAIEHLALGLLLDGDVTRGVLLAGYAAAALRLHDFERQYTERTTFERIAAVVQARASGEDFVRLMDQGAALSAQAALKVALGESAVGASASRST